MFTRFLFDNVIIESKMIRKLGFISICNQNVVRRFCARSSVDKCESALCEMYDYI